MFVEQPERVGRSFLLAILIWSAVAFAVLLVFEAVVPERPVVRHAPVVEASACVASVPTGFFDPSVTGDPIAPILAAPSRCASAAAPATDDPRAQLHAYLEGAELPSAPKDPPPAVDAALRARGAKLYAEHCATCHGQTGDGAGPDKCALQTPATAHKQGVFALRTTEHEALPTDEDLFRTITRGVHGTAMPPWFALPERDRWALVAHVKSLSKQFDEDVAPPPMATGEPPAATPERLAAGRALFVSGGCASCHGETGHGNGPAADAFPIKPRDFTSGRFHRGSSAADIHETLSTGLDGTPMAAFVSVMSADELWNVALYVHSLAPAVIERAGGIGCQAIPRSYDAQELFGVRNLLHTTSQR